MSKVLVIGIDALDSSTLSKLEQDLPIFRRLKEESQNIEFDGVFPQIRQHLGRQYTQA